ncbi:MAG TPA: hypothetical protein PKM73_02410 [Verrucomicrobiota bacterium]|nr:hypothetical protein [Verrucomicrobiota bacterium]HNU49767.1 hypothetical protein [Verrucomicrobiota bacterium]
MKRKTGLVLAVSLALLIAAFYLLRRPGHDVSMGPPIEMAACVPAPPAVEDNAPPTGLTELPPGAIAFDLKYRPQTGQSDDLQYHSYWGFGRNNEADNSFLQSVRKKAALVTPVHHAMLEGRQWSALAHHRRHVDALYFDLNANGQLEDNERIPPTRKADDRSVEFITPDFQHSYTRGNVSVDNATAERVTFRVLLRVAFYGNGDEPNFMWSPAAMLEGTAAVEGKPVRIILFADGFGGQFDRFGSSQCALLPKDPQPGTPPPSVYIPREILSSLMPYNGRFYQVKLDGRRATGHPARAVLIPDTSPVGTLAVKLACAQPVPTRVRNLSLQGADNKTVFFSVNDPIGKLPVARYNLSRGYLTYGKEDETNWTVSFSQGPVTTLLENQTVEVVLNQPKLEVRAVREQDRYNSDAKTATAFSKGTRIYLEPKIACAQKEILSRFGRLEGEHGRTVDTPPRIRITNAEGKELLAQSMEYG